MIGKKTIKFIFLNEKLFVRYTRSRKGCFVSLGKDGILRNSETLNKKILVKEVFISESMKRAKPKSFANWFKNCYRLQNIYGLENLVGDDVKNASSMFENCYCIKELYFGDFSLSQCQRYDKMFYNCGELEVLYAPKLKFLTKSVQPFGNCNKLNKCNADRSVFCNLPLYDNRIKYVCEKFDQYGDKITVEGNTVDELFGEITNSRKSLRVFEIEKAINEAFKSSSNSLEITKLLSLLNIEAANCGLIATFNWNNGALSYDFIIENLVDRVPRKFRTEKKKVKKRRRR